MPAPPPTPARHADEARALLVRVAGLVGFPRPVPEQGLTDWADTCLDGTLLRGTEPWRVARQGVLDALEASLHGSESMVLACLAVARDTTTKAGGHCECVHVVPPILLAQHGKKWCAQCHKKRRAS
jgi:hypothetical protein